MYNAASSESTELWRYINLSIIIIIITPMHCDKRYCLQLGRLSIRIYKCKNLEEVMLVFLTTCPILAVLRFLIMCSNCNLLTSSDLDLGSRSLTI